MKQEKRMLWGMVLVTGTIWGFVEYGAGLGLQKCAAMFSGAILTGISFFWFALIKSTMKRFLPLLVITLIAMGFKWLGAAVSGVAWNHGSVVNPLFALLTAFMGFSIVSLVLGKRFYQYRGIRILAGAGAAFLATLLFPLVKFATGTPACLFGSTAIPVAWITAPLAISLAMIMVPLGYSVANRRFSGRSLSGYFRRTAIFRE